MVFLLLLCAVNSLYANNVKHGNLDSLISEIVTGNGKENDLLVKIKPVKKPAEESYQNLSVLLDSIHTNYEVKKKVVVIDAGHGGKDPGTIGYGNTREKDIVLLYAKHLAAKLRNSGKYKVYLSRDSDKFLKLRNRNGLARKYKADIFISMHADAARNKKARGLSIFTLSEVASDKEAAALAVKENKADLISGVDLTGLEQDVSDALIDLSLRDAKNESIIFAKILHKEFLKKDIRVRRTAVRSAGFVVLKNPNMASILLELGFLSNKHDSRNLRKSRYRDQIIDAMVVAIGKYTR